MISLEQVNALESRVEKAVALIASLRSENESLRTGLATAVSRVTELEARIVDFQKDQARIEEGIVEALRKLDFFEDTVHGAVNNPPAASKPSVHAAKTAPVEELDTVQDADGGPADDPEGATPEKPSDALDIF
jgi:chromosome segregation ATPase